MNCLKITTFGFLLTELQIFLLLRHEVLLKWIHSNMLLSLTLELSHTLEPNTKVTAAHNPWTQTDTICLFICISNYFPQYFVIFSTQSFSLWLKQFIAYYSWVCVVGEYAHKSECAHTASGSHGKEGVKHPMLSLFALFLWSRVSCWIWSMQVFS